MTVHRINGCPLDLKKLTDAELWRLAEYIGRNQDQLERDREKVNEEMARREMFIPFPAS